MSLFHFAAAFGPRTVHVSLIKTPTRAFIFPTPFFYPKQETVNQCRFPRGQDNRITATKKKGNKTAVCLACILQSVRKAAAQQHLFGSTPTPPSSLQITSQLLPFHVFSLFFGSVQSCIQCSVKQSRAGRYPSEDRLLHLADECGS